MSDCDEFLLFIVAVLHFISEMQAIVYLFGYLLCKLVRNAKNYYWKIPDTCCFSLRKWTDSFRKRLRLHDCLPSFKRISWIYPVFDKHLNKTIENRPHCMKYESARLATFESFPQTSPPWITRLAANGFFYSGNNDEVTCFSCSAKHSKWEENDDPAKIHRRISPNCSFVHGQSSNVPICTQQQKPSNNETGEDLIAATSAKVSHSVRKLVQTETTGPSCEERTERLEHLGATGGVPLSHKDTFRFEDSRLQTFTGWPKVHTISPERLASAGLYYTGVEDNVCCWSCGGGLRNWEIGDDPFVMHAQWFPHCKFLQKEKGQDFIEKYQKAHVDDPLEPDIIRSTSSGGSRLYRIDSNVYKLQDYLKQEFTEPEHTTESSVRKIPTALNNASNSGAKEQNTKQSKLSCKLCNENPRNVLFLPCSHVAVCNRCATDMCECLVCKHIIADKRNIYIS